MRNLTNMSLEAMHVPWLLTALLLVAPGCRSGDSVRTATDPWTRQTRREVERSWWFQNRYDDTRPSALNPGEYR